MADELKQPPLPFEVLPPLGEKEKDEEKEPLPFEVLPPNRMPTSTSFGRSLGLRPIEEVLPEEALLPAPKRELATSPVIEEMKAKVEAEVEQGGIWKLRDEADEVSKQFQALQAEQLEAEAMQLPTEGIRKNRAEKLKEWNKKNAELQARRAAFKEKTGFTPDEYGRSEKEIKLLRRQEIGRKLDRIEGGIDAGTTGPLPEPDIFTWARDTDTASLIFGPSKRTEGDWRPFAKDKLIGGREGILPWKKGLDEAFWEAYDSGPKDRNKGLKLLSGVMGAVFEGTPKTPLHKPFQAAKKQVDKSVVEVDGAYGEDSWQAKSWGAYAGLTNTLIDFADIMVGNTGGVATIGVGGALAKVAGAGKGTAAGTAAATTTAATEAAFATHILDGINQSLPQVLDTWYDPNASTKEKAEAVSGTVLAALFAVKLGHSSARTLEGALKSQYGIDINLETATRAELNNAGVRIVRVRENKAAKAEGREPITPKEGETLMEYATRVAAEKVLPKLKGEKQKTFNRIVGEQQALERMRLEERKSGEEIPVEETTIVEPILSERPARPLLEAEPQPIVVPPEVLKFEPEPVDRRADAPDAPEAGSVEAYYGERPTLQVQPKDVAGVRQPDWTAAEAVEGKLPNVFYGTPNLKVRSAVELNFFRMTETKGGTGDIAEGYGRYATFLRDIAKEHYATGQKSGKEGNVYEYSLNFSRDTILDQAVAGGIKSQPEVVQSAWREFMDILNRNPEENGRMLYNIKSSARNATGHDLYGWIATYFTPKAQRMAAKWTPEGKYQGQVLASEFLAKRGVDAMTYKRSDIVHGKKGKTRHENIVILNPDKVRIVSVKNLKDVELLKDKAPFAFAPDKPTAPKEPVVEPVDPTDPRVMEMVERLREEMTVENLLARDAARDAKIAEAVRGEAAAAEAPADLPSWEKKLLQTVENDMTAKGWSELENGDTIRVEPEVAQGWLEGPLKDAKGKFAGVEVVIGEYGGKPTAGLRVESIEKLRKFIQDKGAEPAKPAAEAAEKVVVEDALQPEVVDAFEKAELGVEQIDGKDVRTYTTEDGYKFYEKPDGSWADNLNPALADLSWNSLKHMVWNLYPDGYVPKPRNIQKPYKGSVEEFMETPPPEPAKPAAKAAAEAVKEEVKVDKAAEEVVEAEAKLVAEAGMETVEVKKRMKKLVEREIAFLRQEGATLEDIATARELELDPTSFYDILPSTRWADMISRLSKADVEAMEATEGFPSNLKSMTDGRKVQLNYEAYKAAEKGGNPDAPALKEEYTKSLQEWASDATELGQRIESLKHNPHITPEILVDKINQTLKDSVGGKEIVGKERTELEGLVEKSMDTIKEFKEAQDKFRKKPTEENFNAAFEKLQKSEAASREQWEFMTNHSPKLWADLYVSALQGNLLTPATLVLNVAGNIVPLLLRAPSRATARALDLMHEFYTGKPARRAELRKLREEFEAMADKESPEYADIAAEIVRREKEIISDTIIQPARGALAKFKGLTRGMGLERIREALKAPEGEKWQAFKHRRYDDAISSLLFGQRANMYEVGAETVMSPLSPWRAWKRIGRQISSKEGKQGAEKTLKDLAEGTLGVAPNLMFRALAAGDLPFRHAEFARLVENYGTRLGGSKGWGRDKTAIWIERATKAPEIVFGEKQLLELRNEANRATFQNENLATKYLAKLNAYLRAPKTGGLEGAAKRTLYAGYRSTVPYQKTLVNIVGEYLSYTPLGLVDVALNPMYGKGWTVQRKMATARVLTGLGAYIGVNAIRKMTGTDIISVDYSMGMEDEKRSVAYLSQEVVPHGTINWSALGRFMEGESTAYQKGDRVTNLQKAGPLGDIMLAVSSFQDALEKMPASERENFSENIGNLMLGVGEQKFRFALNQSFAQNARDFVQGLIRTKSPSELFKPWARGVAAVAIPNTLDWFYNNSKDNPWRRNYRSDTFTDELKLSWKKKMIAWDWITSDGKWSEKAGEQNPVIFNLWGEPVERIRRGGMLLGIKKVNPDSSFERYLHSSLGVVETGQIIPTAESSEIWRLWRDTRNSSIAPSIPMRKISRDKVNYELNRDQYAVYQRLIGLRRIKGPPAPPRRARWPSGTEAVIDERWAGMTALLEEGNSYEGGNTAWVDMKQDEQVRHVLDMYSGASRSAGDYLVDNFMLKKPTKENLIALAGLGEDATEKEARAVIKGFSINLDNLGKLEVTEKPSGRLKK